MKKELIVTIVVVILSVFELQAQKGPLRGEGPILSKSFDFKDFDKIAFEDFDGKIEVEIGKPFSIKVAIDENLAPRLQVEKEATEGLLRIYLRENKNGRLYLEDTHISIKVTLPEASVISHRGNTSVKVAGIVGRYFRFENQGNGDVHLEGSIDQLDIKKSGNGSVRAQNLITKIAKVKSYGNGNVWVNAQISLTAHGAGNGNIIQVGVGKIDPVSGMMGNGEVKKGK